MTGKIFDISFENIYSYRNRVTFSMQGIDSDTKSDNYELFGDEIILKTAVVYGANGSGKTNIIRFLDFFLSKLKESMDSNNSNELFHFYEPFLLDRAKSRKKSESGVTLRFLLEINEELRLYTYDVKFNQAFFISESLKYKHDNVEICLFERTLIYSTGKSEINYGIEKPSFSEESVTPTRLLMNLFLSNFQPDITPAAVFLAGVEFANGYNEIMFNRIWKDTKRWLQESKLHIDLLMDFLKHIDVQFKTIVIPEKQDARLDDLAFIHTVYNDNEIAGTTVFPIFKESMGTSALFLIGAKVIQALERGIPLFIDELDSSFHAFITKFILRMFQDKRINRKGAQLILTTHNISLMDEKLLRKDQVWFSNKNKKGISDLYSLADFEDVRDDSRFAEWYMASRFGGVPQIDFSMLKLFDNVPTD